MNIYDIGEEKCIDGTWGREMNGRFYTRHDQRGLLYRALDTDNPEYHHFVYYDVSREPTSSSFETLFMYSKNNKNGTVLTQYVPKHIKDLENLKLGDIVWVKVQFIGKTCHWASTRYIKQEGGKFITTDFFDEGGNFNPQFICSHDKVFLKPSFDF
jgi:hypothetical protein